MSNARQISSENKKKELIFVNKYKIEKNPFQKGRNSRLFKGQMTEHPFTEVAVKQIRQINSEELKLLESEVKLLKELKGNPFIVNFIEHLVVDEQHYLVFEFCDGGDLNDFMTQFKPPLPDRIVHDFFHQIINSMKALHSKFIMHRDIKLNNFVFHKGKLLLADFGFSKQLANENELVSSALGTLETMAPEVLMYENYGMKAEIYSLGVVFYQLAKGGLPFQGQNEMQLLESIQLGKLNLNGVSQDLQNLIKSMLQYDANQRIGMADVVKHPYMAQKIEEEFISSSRLRQDEKNKEAIQNFLFYKNNQEKFPETSLKNNQPNGSLKSFGETPTPRDDDDEEEESKDNAIQQQKPQNPQHRNIQQVPSNAQQQQPGRQPAQKKNDEPIKRQAPPPPQAERGNRMKEDNNGRQQREVSIGKVGGVVDYRPSHSKEFRQQQALLQNKNLDKERRQIELMQEHFMYYLKAGESLYFLNTKFAEYASDKKGRESTLVQIRSLSKQLCDIFEEITLIKDSLKEAQSNQLQKQQLVLKVENLEAQKELIKKSKFELEKKLDKFSIYIGGALMVVVEKAHLMIRELRALLNQENFKILSQQDPAYAKQVNDLVKQGLERLTSISFGSILDYTETKITYYDVFKSYIQEYILPKDEADLFQFTENELPRQNADKFKKAFSKKLRLILLDLLVDLLNESKISFNFNGEAKQLHKQAVKFLTLSLISDDSFKRLTEEEGKLDSFTLTTSYEVLARFVQESDHAEMVRYLKFDQSQKEAAKIEQCLDQNQNLVERKDQPLNIEMPSVSIKEMLLDRMNHLNEVRQEYQQWPTG